jgi:hypothetical protein
MLPFVSPAVATVISALTALLTLAFYIHASRRSDRDSARDEALALAETRRELLLELRAALERNARELQAARLQTALLADRLVRARAQLEQAPPDVEGALASIGGPPSATALWEHAGPA